MSLIGNVIWLIFGGLLAGLGYIIGGLLVCVTIIGLPLGIAAIRFGVSVLTPFGKDVQPKSDAGCLALGFNLLWLVLFGWEIALVHITFALLLAITIVGIPFARQHLKLVPVALLPFSYRLERMND